MWVSPLLVALLVFVQLEAPAAQTADGAVESGFSGTGGGTSPAAESSKPKKSCLKKFDKCDAEPEIMCGTDGITYESPCDFVRARCANKKLRVDYFGECIPEAEQVEPPQECSPEYCSFEYAPVCANGRTYGNECEHARARCRDPTLPRVPLQGACDPCLKECSTKKKSVCGSDGITYLNKCTLRRAACDNGGGWPVYVKKGKCPSDWCSKPCPTGRDPWCASDGKTYTSRCTLHAAAQCDFPGLEAIHEGVC